MDTQAFSGRLRPLEQSGHLAPAVAALSTGTPEVQERPLTAGALCTPPPSAAPAHAPDDEQIETGSPSLRRSPRKPQAHAPPPHASSAVPLRSPRKRLARTSPKRDSHLKGPRSTISAPTSPTARKSASSKVSIRVRTTGSGRPKQLTTPKKGVTSVSSTQKSQFPNIRPSSATAVTASFGMDSTSAIGLFSGTSGRRLKARVAKKVIPSRKRPYNMPGWVAKGAALDDDSGDDGQDLDEDQQLQDVPSDHGDSAKMQSSDHSLGHFELSQLSGTPSDDSAAATPPPTSSPPCPVSSPQSPAFLLSLTSSSPSLTRVPSPRWHFQGLVVSRTTRHTSAAFFKAIAAVFASSDNVSSSVAEPSANVGPSSPSDGYPIGPVSAPRAQSFVRRISGLAHTPALGQYYSQKGHTFPTSASVGPTPPIRQKFAQDSAHHG
ncbi:hypothetical protein VTO73DRAFT_9912 [Trametes versicolor]